MEHFTYLDENAGELIFAVVRGNQDDLRLQGRRIKDNLGIVGFSVQIRQPVVIHDLASDPRWYREFHPDLASRLKNAITFPLLVQGKPIGAVQIFQLCPRRDGAPASAWQSHGI